MKDKIKRQQVNYNEFITGQSQTIIPQHRVLNILKFMKQNIDYIDHRSRSDWAYIISKIAGGKLYEVDFHTETESNDTTEPSHNLKAFQRQSTKVILSQVSKNLGIQWAKELTKSNAK